MKTIIEDLEEQVEFWRQRAEAAEAALGMGDRWDVRAPPLSLYETRVMRVIAERPLTGTDAVRILSAWYPNTSNNSLDVLLHRIRRRLPADIAPSTRLNGSRYAFIEVPDREALKAFLETGALPEVGRQAA